MRGIDRKQGRHQNPEYLEHMAMVKQPLLVGEALRRGYVGMDLKYLQSYLNWYAYLFRVSGRREVAQSGKGAPPFVHGRREFPQLDTL